MKKLAAVLGLGLIIFVAGCSSTRVRTDYDERSKFDDLRTYSWIEQTYRAPRNPVVDNELLEERIQNAVDGVLASRGYRRRDDGDVDFRVAYHIVGKEKTEIIEQDSFRGYYSHRGYGFGSSFITLESLEGTLILDIFDGQTNKLIWRGWATKSLDDDPTPEEMHDYLQHAVRKILKEFPPAT